MNPLCKGSKAYLPLDLVLYNLWTPVPKSVIASPSPSSYSHGEESIDAAWVSLHDISKLYYSPFGCRRFAQNAHIFSKRVSIGGSHKSPFFGGDAEREQR